MFHLNALTYLCDINGRVLNLSSLLARRSTSRSLNRDLENRAYGSRRTFAPNKSQGSCAPTRPVYTRNADLRLVACINTPLGSACQQEASAGPMRNNSAARRTPTLSSRAKIDRNSRLPVALFYLTTECFNCIHFTSRVT